MLQITYQKNDGCIIQRIRKTMIPYNIGDTTSMGWKVLNIEYEYNNKFYSHYNYGMLIYKDRQKYIKKKQLKELIIEKIKTLIDCLGVILFLYCLKNIIGF